jgi:hypothetical protein
VHLKKLSGYVPDFPGEDFIQPLLGPSIAALPDQTALSDRLIRIFDWTYFGGGEGRGKWPGDWLTRGKTLRDNPPILRAFETLERDLQNAQATQRDAFQVVQDGRLTVIRFLDSEKAFLAAASAPRTAAGWQAKVESTWSDLATRRTSLDRLVEDLKRKTGVTGEVTLDSGYRAAVDRIRGGAGRASQRIKASLLKQKVAADTAAQAATGPASEFTLYRDVQRRLATLDAKVNALLEQALPPSEQAQLADLDQQTLRATAAGARGRVSAAGDRLCGGDGAPRPQGRPWREPPRQTRHGGGHPAGRHHHGPGVDWQIRGSDPPRIHRGGAQPPRRSLRGQCAGPDARLHGGTRRS